MKLIQHADLDFQSDCTEVTIIACREELLDSQAHRMPDALNAVLRTTRHQHLLVVGQFTHPTPHPTPPQTYWLSPESGGAISLKQNVLMECLGCTFTRNSAPKVCRLVLLCRHQPYVWHVWQGAGAISLEHGSSLAGRDCNFQHNFADFKMTTIDSFTGSQKKVRIIQIVCDSL